MVIGEKAAIKKTLLGGATFSRLTFFLPFSPSLGCLAHFTILAALPAPLHRLLPPYPHLSPIRAALPIPLRSSVFFRRFHLRARLIKICNYGLINDLKKSCELTSACLKRPRSLTTALFQRSNLELSPHRLSLLANSLPHRFLTLHLATSPSYASSLPQSCLPPVRQPLRPSHLDQLRWEGKIETCDAWTRTF